jgi:hypothetical protein
MKVTNENIDTLITNCFNKQNWEKLFLLIRWSHCNEHLYNGDLFFNNLVSTQSFMSFIDNTVGHPKATERFLDNLIRLSTPEQWEIIRNDNDIADQFWWVLRHGDIKYLLEKDYSLENYYETLYYTSALHPISRELVRKYPALMER